MRGNRRAPTDRRRVLKRHLVRMKYALDPVETRLRKKN
jgi:hypothetical protein